MLGGGLRGFPRQFNARNASVVTASLRLFCVVQKKPVLPPEVKRPRTTSQCYRAVYFTTGPLNWAILFWGGRYRERLIATGPRRDPFAERLIGRFFCRSVWAIRGGVVKWPPRLFKCRRCHVSLEGEPGFETTRLPEPGDSPKKRLNRTANHPINRPRAERNGSFRLGAWMGDYFSPFETGVALYFHPTTGGAA